MSQQVVTRMQDLASEFLIIFRGGRLIPPDPHSGRGDPLPHPTPSPALAGRRAPGRPGVGAKRPGVGTQNLIPLNFSAVVAPLRGRSYFLALSYTYFAQQWASAVACTWLLQLTLLSCMYSRNVARQVFFGRPLLIPSAGVHSVAQLTGRSVEDVSCKPKSSLICNTICCSRLRPVYAITSMLVTL